VRVSGGKSPTGKVRFHAGAGTIPGCNAVPLVSGVASCTTTTLPRGTNVTRGYYSGDSNNAAAIAGPITLTVK